MMKMTHEILQQMLHDDFARPISGFEGYFVTKSGLFISTRKNGSETIRILSVSNDRGGYGILVLRSNGIRHTVKSHRIVALTFIPNPNNYPQVNHKNEIKRDNRVENLEWCTASYNLSYNNGQKKRAAGCRKLGKSVSRLDLSGNVLEIYECIGDAVRSGFNLGEIWRCCKGIVKTHKGFGWKYV